MFFPIKRNDLGLSYRQWKWFYGSGAVRIPSAEQLCLKHCGTAMPSAYSSVMHPLRTPQPVHHHCHHQPVKDVICSASGMIGRNPQIWNTQGIAAKWRENRNTQALLTERKKQLKNWKMRAEDFFQITFCKCVLVCWFFLKEWKSGPWFEWWTKWRLAWESKNSCVGRWGINSSSTEVTGKRSMHLHSHSWMDIWCFPQRWRQQRAPLFHLDLHESPKPYQRRALCCVNTWPPLHM